MNRPCAFIPKMGEQPFRVDGLAFMRSHLKDVPKETLFAKEAEIWQKCHERVECVDVFQKRYRSEVREAVYERRSPAQSPTPPDLAQAQKVASKTLPKCETCKKNDCVTFMLVQRHRSDEGMTPEYECSRCNTFWH